MNTSDARTTPPTPATLNVPLGQLVEALGGELRGDPATLIQRIGPLDTQQPSTLSFLSNPKYRSQLADTLAACVIVSPAVADDAAHLPAAIVTDDPYLYFARLTRWWGERVRPRPAAGVHPSAVVASDAVLGQGVSIGPLAVVEAGAIIEDGALSLIHI